MKFWTLSFCLLICTPALSQTITVTEGISVSARLGEENPGFETQLLLTKSFGRFVVETASRFDTSNKYTGAGWIASQIADFSVLGSKDIGVLAGLQYTYRDGGNWSKQGLWLRAGIEGRRANQTFRIIGRATLVETDNTNSRIIQFEIRQSFKRFVVMSETGIVWFNQPTLKYGWYNVFRFGVKIK